MKIEESNYNAVGGIVIFSLIILWIAFITFRRVQLTINHRYTIGVTIERRSTHKGPRVDYTFNVHGVKYNASKDTDLNAITYSGGRYYVEFLPSDPEVNTILWDRPVPDHIAGSPPDGWVEIPK